MSHTSGAFELWCNEELVVEVARLVFSSAVLRYKGGVCPKRVLCVVNRERTEDLEAQVKERDIVVEELVLSNQAQLERNETLTVQNEDLRGEFNEAVSAFFTAECGWTGRCPPFVQQVYL